jgi:hypothetical protein
MSDWLKESRAASADIADALRIIENGVHDLRRAMGETEITGELEVAAMVLRSAYQKVAASRDLALTEMLNSTQDSFANITKLVLSTIDQ